MGSGSWKLETRLAAGELPEFLRRLADVLASDALEPGAVAPGDLAGMPRAPRKLVLVAEAKGGGLELKLKAKREGELRVPTKPATAAEAVGTPKPAPRKGPDPKAARARDKYRQLKKTMQADYKALRKAAEAGTMPAQDVLESFLALCEAMAEMEQPLGASSAGGGPEGAELARANAAFVEDAKSLRAAVSARKAPALLEALDRLERRKSACHAQFKPLGRA